MPLVGQPADASPKPSTRYNFRKRSQMRAPARFADAGGAAAAAAAAVPRPAESAPTPAPQQPSLLDAATLTLDLTDHLLPSATLQQPFCDVHVDEVADFGFGSMVDNAVFSHAWAPDGRGVFACGGPLAMGIRGCYMSLWS